MVAVQYGGSVLTKIFDLSVSENSVTLGYLSLHSLINNKRIYEHDNTNRKIYTSSMHRYQ